MSPYAAQHRRAVQDEVAQALAARQVPTGPEPGDRVSITVSGRVERNRHTGHSLWVLLDGGSVETAFTERELANGSVTIHPIGIGARVVRADVPPDMIACGGTVINLSKGALLAVVEWEGSDDDVSVHRLTDLRRAT